MVKKPQDYADNYILKILQQLFLLVVFLFVVPVFFVDKEIVFICLRFATSLVSRAFSVKFGTRRNQIGTWKRHHGPVSN